MKKFNINGYMYIQITDIGWEHLNDTVGKDYIKHCIEPYVSNSVCLCQEPRQVAAFEGKFICCNCNKPIAN